MTRRVIINADDFGLSPGVNRGIVSGFREGVLSSTTMLVNLEFFDDAVRLARENPDLPLGVHLSLLWGRPVSDPSTVPSLVEGDGRFPRSLTTLASRYFLGRLARDQVRAEFRNQIRTFLEAGLTPTHLDTHKHVHCLGGILDALISVAREFGIDKVRLPSEDRPSPRRMPDDRPGPRGSRKSAGKRRLIRFLCRGARERLSRAGIRTADHFAGIEHGHCLNSDVLNLILSNLGTGTTEIMCHPGYTDEHAQRYASTPPHREVELESLKDPRIEDCLAAGAIQLIHYGEL
jgi:hopanoid biosynthesis associated protein HpnK